MTERGAEEVDPQVDKVQRAIRGGGVGDMFGEVVRWRGHNWSVADVQNDGQHVHLTLTNPRQAQYQASTNDG